MPLLGLVPTKAGAVSVRVVCVSAVVVELAAVLDAVVAEEAVVELDCELTEADVDVVELVEELAGVAGAGTVRVTVTVAGVFDPTLRAPR